MRAFKDQALDKKIAYIMKDAVESIPLAEVAVEKLGEDSKLSSIDDVGSVSIDQLRSANAKCVESEKAACEACAEAR